jgi:hypothetical protein
MSNNEYESFIRNVKSYATRGESYRLKMMKLLVEMRPLTRVWQKGPYQNWDDMLRQESLCTPAHYRAFEKATTLLSDQDIERFGVYASALIARVPAQFRQQIIKQTRSWIALSNMPPTYQLIAKHVSDLIPKSEKKKQGPTVKELREEVEVLRLNVATLKKELGKHKIAIPPLRRVPRAENGD